MASSRKTLDVDIITLRQVNIRGSNNTIIPSSSVLLSDGRGGTFWSYISTAGNYPSFNQIQINSNIYTATPSNRSLSFLPGDGIGFTDGGPGCNTAFIFAKAFQTLTVPGLSTIFAYSNGVMYSNLFLSTAGGLLLSTDVTTNTVHFRAGINTINVIQNTSSIRNSYAGLPSTILPITTARSTLQFVGIGDVFVTPNIAQNTLTIGVNGYTEQSYRDLSENIYGFESTMLGIASTVYVSKVELSTSVEKLSTLNGFSISTISFQNNFSNYDSIVGSTLSTFSSVSQFQYSSLLTSTLNANSRVSTSLFLSISTLSSHFFQLNQSTISTFMYRQLTSTNSGFSTTLFNRFGQLYSTLSSFGGAVSTIELLSTTSSFLLEISSVRSTINSTINANFSSLSTSLTSYLKANILPKITLVSSLAHGGSLGNSIPFFVNSATSSVTFSTASFRLRNALSSITSARADVSIEYNPVLLLPMASTAQLAPQNFCTVVAYNGTTIVPTTTYSDTVSFNQYLPGPFGSALYSNIYSKYMRIRLDTAWILSNGDGEYSIYHHSPGLAARIHNYGPSINSTLHIRTPSTNSLFLNIFNVD